MWIDVFENAVTFVRYNKRPRGEAFFLRSSIMSARFAKSVFFFCCVALMLPLSAFAQNNNNNFQGSAVGGVVIDASGALSGKREVLNPAIRKQLEKSLKKTKSDIAASTKMRMISLGGLEAAIIKSKDEGTPLPSEIVYLAGLQRIEFVIKTDDDIILAGPAEGFKINDFGDVVGITSGAPVLRLEDFLIAMRSVDNARSGSGVSVSIDPTPEGVKNLDRLLKSIRQFDPSMQTRVEEAMGPQTITLTGIPTDSRFSHVLVAADYKMKRLSMGLEKSPIDNFPSVMEIAKNSRARNMKSSPRFWMECNYDPIAVSEDGNVWQIRGQGVKTLTDESHFDRDGKASNSGKQNRFAKQWAESMTERFEELADAEPVFRELRNVMDMSVVAAIIKREQLAKQVGLETPAILGLTNAVVTPSLSVPKTVPTQCSFIRVANSWLVSASGGVLLDSWGVAANTESVAELATIEKLALNRTSDAWWWNAASN